MIRSMAWRLKMSALWVYRLAIDSFVFVTDKERKLKWMLYKLIESMEKELQNVIFTRR